ncbi:transporter substrate-binding domain-containing protein [Leucobacter sp. UT-8R-CII-1-4]|uniref:transporter substrate-binding domain-containing protein n=1 Tax=Leucobacter sp. UT-8R-CII-1-4 TaxID=3040075 RepID=UPI0024A87B10|nr:transporter substrate-binding domain-containing protein [Leucobacter sp. UT-8R-CII-1-4]MDI6022157.1 transporter substrate-binding domain-containing protein [Leucobacter sp. UT-8R-CII-1-4]
MRNSIKFIGLLTTVGLGLGLAACAPAAVDTSASSESDTAAEAITVEKVDEIAALLPADIADKGYMQVVTTLGMAPMNFPNTKTNEVEGFNPDLSQAVADVLGIERKLDTATIDQIIPGIDAKKYDVAFANMAITPERLEVLDLVEYYLSSSQVGVKQGNPENVSIDDLCGHAVGVSNGSFQLNVVLPEISDACVADGKQAIDIQAYPDQQKALLAVLSGRISAATMDGPILQYLMTKEPEIEAIGKVGPSGPSAIGTGKESGMSPAITAALQHLMDTGVYDELLAKWGIQDLGVEEAKVLR